FGAPAPRVGSKLPDLPAVESSVHHPLYLGPGNTPPGVVRRGLPHADDKHMRELSRGGDRAPDERRRVTRRRPVESQTHGGAVVRELQPVRVRALIPHAPPEPCVRCAGPLPEPVPTKSGLPGRLEGRLYCILVQEVPKRRISLLPRCTII